jgi:peptidoglycan/LPS O-acetylase OafA/YrhL
MQDRLDGRNNALNFVRLLLAGLVIVSHTWPSGGFGADPQLGDLNLGSWAVAGFFAISGYLVTGSRMSLPLGQFALRRILRIYPGYWACLIVVGFVFAPLAALGTGLSFEVSHAAPFVWLNFTTVLLQLRVGRELEGVPHPNIWDASLWTLHFELGCYVLTGLVLCLEWARRDLIRTTVAVCVALTIFNVSAAHMGIVRGTEFENFLRMAAYFAAGSLLWSLRDRIRINRWWVTGSGCALVVFAGLGDVDLLGALPLAYLVLAFGAWCPVLRGVRRDLSYGVYVYAWPVQQGLALAGAQRFGPVVFMVAAVMLVVPLAWLSWTYVERPALRMVPRRSPLGALKDVGLLGDSSAAITAGPAEEVVA